ncbi:MAG: class I SAM-dependent methyltransferase family protein [Nitrososphaerota archaeon]
MNKENNLKDILSKKFPFIKKEDLPRKVRFIGNIALIRCSEKLDPYLKEIGEIIMKLYPSTKSVLKIERIEGDYRIPKIKLIAGNNNTETIHKEYGCKYKLDVSKLMFCLGNSFERVRTAIQVREWETIIDMFGGIGQFSIPAAKISRAKKIYAIEINPLAYYYLKENIKLNGTYNIEAILGDSREIILNKLRGVADRVFMGYFPETIKFFEYGLEAISEKGGIIHFHDLIEKENGLEKIIKKIFNIAISKNYYIDIVDSHVVKSYSKYLVHIAIQFFAIPKGK